MSPRSPDVDASLSTSESLEARKKYLLLACACDRVELALAWRKPKTGISGALAGLVPTPWVQTAASLLTPFLPRKIRAAAFLYKMWQARR